MALNVTVVSVESGGWIKRLQTHGSQLLSFKHSPGRALDIGGFVVSSGVVPILYPSALPITAAEYLGAAVW